MTLFNRFRRASALRVVFVVAALLTAQSAVACALEAAVVAEATEIAAAAVATDDCCNLCLDCANCGACHAASVSPRAAGPSLSFRSAIYATIAFPTAAPQHWTPAELLRPPISAA